MKNLKIAALSLLIIGLSGCHVETRHHPHDFSLEIYFTPTHQDHWGWAATTTTVFDYYGIYYTQADLVDFHYHHYHYSNPSIDDLSWILWDLGGIDSHVESTLSFSEIKHEIDLGNPIYLHYGGYYSGHFLLVYGYDHRGHVYLHDPGYGTRVVHYDELFYQYFHGAGHYWEASLITLL